MEDTRKAALVFMHAADTYQGEAEKEIKVKIEELEDTREAAPAFTREVLAYYAQLKEQKETKE